MADDANCKSRNVWLGATLSCLLALASTAGAQSPSKEASFQKFDGSMAMPKSTQPFALPGPIGGSAVRGTVGQGDAQFPMVVVRGTPYEMGLHLVEP